ncbi:50S ribosomal protein L13 [Candidatus Arthromitus sp. SFB-mouse-Japan]|uniref:50S ribosomal protein L13 n=1 Tax=unclassified Candidatus Neoarthromitus TaxID=2638829 RepID=UPI00021B8130|nr:MULTISPECIES: 50S ribosomal protein L13 [unclassified Candidatus Arthromitus]EIA24422.1 50S ribosomal protein L13 [Candidatus Arthromitus sp. SFB-1]EIA27621.1 50S ribosomal protein L13 [Candidatus Arthromitus sp. SFB-4]EIA28850.1 50S ribosomal protein L13 [Candidatus Arthromitus sp. SFB-co]EIA30140.1 50S ribosomal protein L13 [Candidatus Arthromitus sp. SFB-mouse-SU]AID45333.1 LSU ribosomal protein L13 [Candidatus Arthromitus sp. SFB-mouse-NL]
MKSHLPKENDIQKQWYVVDVEGMVLGRAASQIASILRGKHKPEFTPNMDLGDFVIVLNADKIVLTGKKLSQKMYSYHTGYPGGRKEISYNKLLDKKPEFLFYEAVRRMLPSGPLARRQIKKLKIYKGNEHNHQAQNPVKLELKY